MKWDGVFFNVTINVRLGKPERPEKTALFLRAGILTFS